MRRALLIAILVAVTALEAEARCARWPDRFSSAFNPTANAITLPWRTDFPAALVPQSHAWEAVAFNPAQSPDWQAYMAAVIGEVKASGLQISGKALTMNLTAPWFIAPWMDQGRNGREFLMGLTKERGPDARDLSPTSTAGHQVWAVGFYNAEGAFGLGKVFADPCNPKVPAPVGGQPWQFPNGTASFKLLFTDAPDTEVAYLAGSPVVEAMIEPAGGGTNRTKRDVRLLQVDIAVRDPRATQTRWVFGTFIWKGPPTGDGFFDNLVPVGLIWGNDPTKQNNTWAGMTTLSQSGVNPALAGVVWQGAAGGWPERPYPGFQGRVNGPADNLRSSCLSCHGLAQWRRNPTLGIVPSYPISPTPTTAKITQLRTDYFRNVKGGTLTVPAPNTTALDYSLQLEAGFTRLCAACRAGQLTGPTPDVCKVPGAGQITQATCPSAISGGAPFAVGVPAHEDRPARQ